MISYRHIWVLCLCLFVSMANAQIASSEFDIGDIINESSNEVSESNDPINGWPNCVQPENIKVGEEDGSVRISWDNPDNDIFELRIDNALTDKRSEPFRTVEDHFIIADNLIEDFDKISLRRVCSSTTTEFYSIWTEVNIAALTVPQTLCTSFYHYMNYSYEETGGGNNITIRKKLNVLIPNSWDKVEVEYEWYWPGGGKSNGGSNSGTTYSYTFLPGQLETIDIPIETSYMYVKNMTIYRNQGSNTYQCGAFHILTPNQVTLSACDQTVIYQVQPSAAGNDYAVFLISPEVPTNGPATVDFDDGTMVPFHYHPFGYENNTYVYSGEVEGCEDFTINFTNCGDYYVDNPCNGTDDPLECDDFEFNINPTPFFTEYVNEETNEKDTVYQCAFTWSFPEDVENGSIRKTSGGPFYNMGTGSSGMAFLEAGEYKVKYQFKNNAGEIIHCFKTIDISCNGYTDPGLTEEQIDSIISCDQGRFTFGENSYYDGQILNCTYNWSFPDSVSVVLMMSPESANITNSYSSNSGSVAIRNLNWEISYIIGYNHPVHGWIYNECKGDNAFCTEEDTDSDGDGVIDDEDNCITVPNPDQKDSDGDGIGDACEPDTDGDGIIDDDDNCVYIPNPDQVDYDLDGIGDVCEDVNDADEDGVPDDLDNCPLIPNPDQEDEDEDGIGDVCESDIDGDGVIDDEDNCVYIPNTDQKDGDHDGIGDVCDDGDEDILEFDSTLVCGVFLNMEGVYLDMNSFSLSVDADQYDQIFNYGYDQGDVDESISLIQTIEVSVNYETASGPFNENIILYDKDQNADFITFDPADFTLMVQSNEEIRKDVTYDVTITTISGDVFNCTSSSITLEDDTSSEEEEPDVPDMPNLKCGEKFESPESSTTSPLTDLEAGEIVYMNGFPVVVSEITSANPAAGIYSGFALLPLPFNSSPVIVELNNLTINKAYIVTNGSIGLSATASQLQDISGVNVPVLTIGDNYCVPPEEVNFGEDPSGGNSTTNTNNDGGSFGDDGIHSGTGTEFDFNGFDVNGGHFTGNPYNEHGCTADGYVYDNPTEECDPSSPYSDIETIINDQEPLLNDNIKKAVEDLLGKLDINLDDLDCEADSLNLRTAYNDYITGKPQAEIDRISDMILGEYEEFIKPGMSLNFENAPTLPPGDNYRDQKIKDIEKYHVDLYNCDDNRMQYTSYIKLLEDETTQEQIKQFIIDEISTWTEYEVKELFDPENEELFQPWLADMIVKFFNLQDSEDTGYIDLDPRTQEGELFIKDRLYEVFDAKGSSYFSDANMEYVNIDISGQTREAFNFEFEQGFQEVLGVNRAFFLEKIAELNGNDPSVMPIKVPTPMDGQYVDVYLDDLNVSPDKATIDVYAILNFGANGKAVLQADDITFTSDGIEKVVLTLLSNIELQLINPAKITILSGTSLEWKCGGLDNFVLKSEVEICNEYVVPYNLSTNTAELDKFVSFAVDATGSSWMDFTFELKAKTPFALTKYPEWGFELDHMIIDNSSSETPAFNPMLGYESNHLVGEGAGATLGPGWKGFYLKELKIHIPQKIANNNPIESIAFENVLFDDQGASGKLSVNTKILDKKDGQVGGWGFGIDGFNISVMKNNISGFGIHGVIETPLFTEELKYDGSMHSPGNYALTIKADLEQKKNVPLFIAEAKLSAFKIDAIISDDYDGLQLSATVTGDIELKSDSPILDVLGNFPKMEFTDLTIRNYGDKLDVKEWKLVFPDDVGSMTLWGFEIGFGDDGSNSFSVKTDYPEPNKVGIPMNVGITFLEDIGVYLSGGFDVTGTLDETEDIHKWKFAGVDMNEFCAKGGWKGVKIDENNPICLEWYDNDEWGTGFRGDGKINIDIGPFKMDLSVVSQFGKKDGDKYFFLDALTKLPVGITVGPLLFNGFGGGLAYHMRPEFDFANVDFTKEFNDIPEGLGSTFSGGEYIIDNTYGYSVKALTLFELASLSEVLNGSAFLGVSFGTSGNLKDVQLGGVAKMMAGIDLNNIPVLGDGLEKLETLSAADKSGKLTEELNKFTSKPLGAAITGYVYFKFDMANKAINGDFKVFMDAAGILEGAADDKSVVNAKLYFKDFKDWYVNIGTPQDPCGVKLNALVLNVKLEAYFDIGTTIPPFTNDHLSPKIRSFVKNNVKISEAFRKSGGGIMFGMGFNLKIEASIWIGKVEVYCGAGFDVMIRKTNVECIGGDGKVGINGWYAMGQVWAYVDASLTIAGLKVLGVGLYAVLNAQFPNPVFVQGAVQVKIKLLFVKVDKTLRFKLGEQCLLADPAEGDKMDIITTMLPFNGLTNVPTNQSCEVFMIIPKNSELNEGEDKWKVGDLEYSLIDSDGVEVHTSAEWDDEDMVVEITPSSILKGNTEYTLTASVDYKKYTNGSLKSSNTDEKSITFTTGDSFVDVPIGNIEYAYPVPGMYNFYPKEKVEQFSNDPNGIALTTGETSNYDGTPCYVKLKQGQYELFSYIPEGLYSRAVISVASGTNYAVPMSYSFENKTMDFHIPSSIAKGSICKVELGFFSDKYIQESVLLGKKSIQNVSFGESTQFKPKEEKIVLLEYFFRVSEFDQFIDKMNQVSYSDNDSPLLVIKQHMNAGNFDMMEIYGEGDLKPLVSRTIKSDKFELLKNDVLEPLKGYFDKHYVSSNLKKAYYGLISTSDISFSGPSPQSLLVGDWSTSNQAQAQSLNIDIEKNWRNKYGAFLSELTNAWDARFEDAEEDARYTHPFSGTEGESLQQQCENNNGSLGINNFSNYQICIIDYYETHGGFDVDFLVDFQFYVKTIFPLWKFGTDKMKVDFNYKLPNGRAGSHYSKTVIPN